MNGKQQTLFAILALAVGFASGHWLRLDSEAASAVSTEKIGAATVQATLAVQPANPTGLFGKSDRIATAATTVSYLDKLTLADFPIHFASARGDATAGRLIAKRWAEVDPSGMRDYLIQNPEGDAWPLNAWEILFRTWASADPATAFRQTSGIPSRGRENAARRYVMEAALATDVDQALGMVTPGLYVRPESWEWLENDPGGIARKLADVPNSPFRSHSMRRALEAWYERSPGETVQFLQTLSGSLARDAQKVVELWSRDDPAAAADFVALQTGDESFLGSAEQLLQGWSESDPAAAWDWAGQNLLGSGLSTGRRRILDQLATIDPAAGFDLLDAIENESAKRYLTSNFLKEISKNDVSTAIAWARDEPDDDQRARHFAAIGNEWARRGMRDAGAYAIEQGDALPVDFAQEIWSRWGERYPMEALGRSFKLPEEYGITVMDNIMGSWSRKDPNGAAAHSLKMGNKERVAVGIPAMSRNLFRHDYQAGVDWLIAQQKLNRPEPVLQDAVRRSGLSTSQRTALLNTLGLEE